MASEAERGALLHEGAANVVVAGTDAARALAGEGARELNSLGIPVTIVDLTAVPQTVAQTGRKASDADIMAGVLSTELATFATPVPVAKASQADIDASVLITELAIYYVALAQPVASEQSQAIDADIMSSVISTERAAYGE